MGTPPKDRGLQWPYLPPHFPLPTCLFLEEIDIQCCSQDAKRKSHDYSCKSSYRVLMLAHLQLMLMPQRMSSKEEVAFWRELDPEMGEDLRLGVLPLDVWLKDIGQWVWWGQSQRWRKKVHP